jgi:PilZ domain
VLDEVIPEVVPNGRDTELIHFAVRMKPSEWLDAWRPERSRLLLPTPTAPRLHGRVAARVQLSGQPACATVFGTAVSVQRHADQFRAEIAVDAESLRAVKILTAAARGERIRFLERPLRYVVKLPVIVPWNGGQVYTSTVSISEGGCALRWSGTPPGTGSRLVLRMGAKGRSLDFSGVVCWSDPGSSVAGVRVFATGMMRDVWKGLLTEAARAGAAAA